MFAEDLSAFFDTQSGFGVTATVGGISVPVVFDAAGIAALNGVLETVGPQCIAASQDVAHAQHGTTVSINAQAYVVTGVEPDGTGITTLQLRKA